MHVMALLLLRWVVCHQVSVKSSSDVLTAGGRRWERLAAEGRQAVEKQFFFEKRTKKLSYMCALALYRSCNLRKQKFFVSFFQKRNTSSLHPVEWLGSIVTA
jgi:hypothetical protein